MVRRALVTGAAGFVGRHFARRLLDDGWQVHAFDIRPFSMAGAGAAWTQDARDFFRIDDSRYELVVHCAAVVGGRQKIEKEPLDLAVDLAIDAGLFQWAQRTRPARIVYFSSSAVYPVHHQNGSSQWAMPEPLVNPGSSTSVGMPDLTYGWSKLTGELLAMHAEQLGLRVHVFRPFSGYGNDQDLTYPFPTFIDRARQRMDPFPMWGDGLQCRDWIHIDDIVSAVMVAMERDVLGPVNLGSGQPTNFRQLARLVCEVAGYEPQFRYLQDEPQGVRFRVADVTRMREFYVPKVTLREGVERALDLAKVRA